MAAKILIVEDEANIVEILDFNLKKEGFETDAAFDGAEGLKKAQTGAFDLILLDLMLPIMDGFEVCRRLRETCSTPVLILTAREDENDKIQGLELGADDYITKPFSVKELIARIRANLRRQNLKEAPPVSNITVFDNFTIDRDNYEVKRAGEVVNLTLREFELLSFLSISPAKVFTREQLLKDVWGYEYATDEGGRTVDVTIKRLREKVEPDGPPYRHILTKRGVGYYFEP